MSGSGLFSNAAPGKQHLVQGQGGLAGEINDVRSDVKKALTPLAAITVQEYTNPGATGAATVKAATATVTSIVTLLPTDLLAPGLAVLAGSPRNLLFTTAGSTASDAPANVVINGTDQFGKVQSETLVLSQTAAVATGLKAFKTVTSIVYPAADGTGATIAIGVGKAMALPHVAKARAGLAAIVKEVVAGAVVTNGVLDATNSTYTPSTGQDGANDYAIYYEYDPLGAF